jgi:hypothetical protein
MRDLAGEVLIAMSVWEWSGDEFGRAVARAVVAKASKATGFDCAHLLVVDAVVDVLLRYIPTPASPRPSTPTSPSARSPSSSTSSRRLRWEPTRTGSRAAASLAPAGHGSDG